MTKMRDPTTMSTQAAQKLEEKIRKIEAKRKALDIKLTKERARLKANEKRLRLDRFKEVGKLAEMAGILEVEKEVLLGGFLRLSEILKQDDNMERFKEKGKTFFNSKKDE